MFLEVDSKFQRYYIIYTIGEDGQDALDSVGCDTMDANVSYDDVMTHLRNIFGTEETVYVYVHDLLQLAKLLEKLKQIFC